MSKEKSSSKGLGRGLGALLGDAAMEKSSVSSDIALLPLSQLEAGTAQPRKHFDEEALNELASSIKEHGVLQAITVRPLANGYYQIIAGERRFRGAKLAGLTQIPVHVIEVDDKKATEIALIENLQREDLNPMEEAAGYKRLMTEHNLTQEETAMQVGKSRSAVANATRLLSLPQEIQWLLEQGTLSAGHARALLSLKEEQQENLAERIVRLGLSVRETENLVKRIQAEEEENTDISPKEKLETPSYFNKETEKKLSSLLGKKVKLIPGKRKNKLQIEFQNEEEFKAILKAMEALRKEDTQ